MASASGEHLDRDDERRVDRLLRFRNRGLIGTPGTATRRAEDIWSLIKGEHSADVWGGGGGLVSEHHGDSGKLPNVSGDSIAAGETHHQVGPQATRHVISELAASTRSASSLPFIRRSNHVAVGRPFELRLRLQSVGLFTSSCCLNLLGRALPHGESVKQSNELGQSKCFGCRASGGRIEFPDGSYSAPELLIDLMIANQFAGVSD